MKKILKLLGIITFIMVIAFSSFACGGGGNDIVNTPTANIPAGSVPYDTKIILSTTTEGATIYYTTNGNDPYSSGIIFSSSSPINLTKPTTIKAYAKAPDMIDSAVMTAIYTTTYTVFFKSNNGTIVSPILNVEHGSTITAPTSPEKISVDHQFVGWYKDEDLIKAWDFSTDTVNSNITLYAKWFNSSLTYNLGDTGPGGGKIFYRNEIGFTVEGSTRASDNFASYIAHYFEAAPNDISSDDDIDNYSDFLGPYYPSNYIIWNRNSNYNENLKEQGIGYGRRNTSLITAPGYARYPAARVCNNYSNYNQTDWFLPSRLELEQLYKNKENVGNMIDDEYWSSSTTTPTANFNYNDMYPYFLNFDDGRFSFYHPYGGEFRYKRVRPIRAF